jgi:proteasome lid subunit RPN8/RPN11
MRGSTFHDQPATVRIRQAALDAMAAHAREVAPHECCGLVLGLPDVIELAYRAGNERRSATRYLVAPADHFAAIRFARARHIEVIGAYHSHPRGPAMPSDTDRAEAHDAFLYVIVSLEQRKADITAWKLASGNFFRVPLVPVP